MCSFCVWRQTKFFELYLLITNIEGFLQMNNTGYNYVLMFHYSAVIDIVEQFLSCTLLPGPCTSRSVPPLWPGC